MFLIFRQSEPQRSYEHVRTRFLVMSHDSIRGCVYPLVGPLVGLSIRNFFFFWQAKTKTAKDLCRVLGHRHSHSDLFRVSMIKQKNFFPSVSLLPKNNF